MIIECEAKIWEDIMTPEWGMLKAWLIQECYLKNNFHDDPALTGIFTHQILFHGQDMSMKSKLQSLSNQVSLTSTMAKSNEGEIKATAKKLKNLEKDFKSYVDSHW